MNATDLTEDVPYGLIVIKGIALLAGVDTPYIDRQLYWCQEKMGMPRMLNMAALPMAFPFLRFYTRSVLIPVATACMCYQCGRLLTF